MVTCALCADGEHHVVPSQIGQASPSNVSCGSALPQEWPEQPVEVVLQIVAHVELHAVERFLERRELRLER